MLAIEDKTRQHVPLSVYKEFPHFECFVISLCVYVYVWEINC